MTFSLLEVLVSDFFVYLAIDLFALFCQGKTRARSLTKLVSGTSLLKRYLHF